MLTDVAYMKLGLGASLTKSRGVDLLGVSVGASAGLTVEMVIAEAAAAYEIARWNGLSSASSTTALDLYAGARAWWQRAEADLAISGTLNFLDLTRTANGTFSAQGNVSWVDPLVGVRLRHQFAPAWISPSAAISAALARGANRLGKRLPCWSTSSRGGTTSPGAAWPATKRSRPTIRAAQA